MCLYSARHILISGSCKCETGAEHASLINIEYLASDRSKLRTISITSDGKSWRGEALVRLMFKHWLNLDSPIYDMLHVLPLIYMEVGNDDLTADNDYKHVFKQHRNLLLWDKGCEVHGIHVQPSVIHSHLTSNDLTQIWIEYLLHPNNWHHVKLAYDMLYEVWSLPDASPNTLPGFHQVWRSFKILGSLFWYILNPYICIDLSLSEQLVHLSVAAHLLLALFSEDQAMTNLMPTQLYVDIMIMIRNAYFCITKTKVDDPNGNFWIILLGTDCLEVLYGILCTMVRNDANLDVLQLGLCLTGTT